MRPNKNQAAIDMLLSWRDGDPQEQEETLRVIEEALAEHECQQVKHCWVEEYYGHRCQNCGLFYPFDCAPWDEVS